MSKIKDLRGQRFGSRVVYAAALSRHGKARWKVRCDCGATAEVFGAFLRRGEADRCRVCSQQVKREQEFSKIADLPGREVLGLSDIRRSYSGIFVQVRCGCGFVSDVRVSELRRGSSLSCISCANSANRQKRMSSKFNAESCNV